jgi:ribosomal protein L29
MVSVKYYENLPSNFPKDELDIYRVEEYEDGSLLIRFDLHRNPHYIKISSEEIEVYSKYLKDAISKINLESYSLKSFLEELIYYFIAALNNERLELLSNYENLLDKIAEGKLKTTAEIRKLRRKIAELYSDVLSLYHVTRKLSKFVDHDLITRNESLAL